MKDIKHQMHIDELMGVIREYDEQSLNERAERYAFLLSLENGKENTMFHGEIAHLAFFAAGNAYINAHFIGSVVLAQVVIEHTLNQIFFAIGEDMTRESFPNLIRKAEEKEWITNEEHEAFSILKDIRNPYVHFRNPLNKHTLLKRTLDSGKEQYEILEEDAKHAITAMYKLINKTTF
ncbi:hypothetical protein [Aneurinibacillus aneurinilyticus]|jgi:hypothetical protein|uniref:DUF4145 domain-containing protein n=1 Tax=Aneurinibacillus aneurinilyticus TaxID=1391 RepID=A0A848D624_ANEAE|nr:hypothetical protein [Aneurinibacillus aneurinilyticus]NMF01588.1 hypothetical protein [Aneurinibacillus aneurinilyticus]